MIRPLTLCLLLLTLVACSTSAPAPVADRLVIAGWAGYMPQAILDAFQAETGVTVEYRIYETQPAAIEHMRAGTDYDLVVMGSYFVPQLIKDGLLAPIDYRQIPNFRYISASFRDLSYDPGGKYSIVYQWGVGGLVVRTDLLDRPVTRWVDLWDPSLAGKIAMWVTEDELFAIALKSIGQPLGTTDPAILAQAAERIRDLLPRIVALDPTMPNAATLLADGTYPIVYGWTFDALEAQSLNPAVEFVLPEEGAMLWIDTFVVPDSSTRKSLAWQFIDFVLRPEMSALVTNEIFVATANEYAVQFIDPALRDHPWIFPSGTDLMNAEYLEELPPDILAYRHQLWQELESITTTR
ncbi:MAG: spermidine/putrescine ABC transporter substrate-binding protein [Chloroflexus sp.]|uniref:polyamine ABC transporter substrate-binding protein n=1 Tax=Chloroflexus sp. TaxID=1904827 RepID=UPI0030A3874B